MIDYAKCLNKEQYEATNSTDGPVLVLAGAGSGKTRVLTHKIAFLIGERRVRPDNILAVTFTNKAATEMKERVANLLNISVKGLWIGTFHSICGRILRVEGDKLGFDSMFSIYDRDDSERVVKNAMDELGMKGGSLKPKDALDAISGLKNEMIYPEDYRNITQSDRDVAIYNIYSRYQEALYGNNAVDFDDMLMHTVKLLSDSEEVRGRWANRFSHILVDEFQDTNHAQYRFIKLIAGDCPNITAVGDDDQSIYSWRGARVSNILDFPEDFPKARIVKLEQNYRSTQHILSAACAVVAHNSHRHEKKLWTDKGKGNLLCIKEFSSDRDEADYVVNEIEKGIKSGKSPAEFAILYRINYISRLYEERLGRLNIPHEVVGGIRFYNRAEVKDILAYLRLIANPRDDEAFVRAANTPKRCIGNTSLLHLREYAIENNIGLFEAIEGGHTNANISKRARTGLRLFRELIDSFVERIDNLNVVEMMEAVLEASGYANMLVDENTPESLAKMENLQELVNSAREYVDSQPEDSSLVGYLEQAALISDVDSYEGEDKVSLMTVHSAKGLEFDEVFIVAMEDGIFPVIRGDEDIEEERRLAYVAITRGKTKVTITHARQRARFGEIRQEIESRFIGEIPREHVDVPDIPKMHIPEPKKDSGAKYTTKMRVNHPFFGRGLIIKVRGSGENAILTINFKDHGVKRLVAGFAKLEILS